MSGNNFRTIPGEIFFRGVLPGCMKCSVRAVPESCLDACVLFVERLVERLCTAASPARCQTGILTSMEAAVWCHIRLIASYLSLLTAVWCHSQLIAPYVSRPTAAAIRMVSVSAKHGFSLSYNTLCGFSLVW